MVLLLLLRASLEELLLPLPRLLTRLRLEHIAIEVDLDSWVLLTKVVQHRLDVAHNSLEVDKVQRISGLLLLGTR